ncbi:hypothetical protein ScPMuIL_015617, partial [Solemya velum]
MESPRLSVNFLAGMRCFVALTITLSETTVGDKSVAKVEDVDSQRKFLILEELKCMGLFIVDKNE